MKVDININVNLEEIKEILTNADQLQKFVETSIEDLRSWVMNLNEYGRDYGTPSGEEPEQQDPAPDNDKGNPAPNQGKGEPNPDKGEADPSAEVSLEMVRARLAALMQGGRQADVKALLQKHGGEKLSYIPEHNYQALLKEAEDL